MSDVDYLVQSMYEPTAFVVPGFPPAMPAVDKPPIGLNDQEILCVIAYLQTLGGTPTVTLKTTHKYTGHAPAPAAAPAPGAAQPLTDPKKGAQLKPVVTHQAAARIDGAAGVAR
jgi:hypothetical protein